MTGTIEEKIYQRQLSKRELHNTIVDDKFHDLRQFSGNDLKKLFVLAPERVRSETFDLLRTRQDEGRWDDYRGAETIKCPMLRLVAAGETATAEGGGPAAVTSSYQQGQSSSSAAIISFVHEEVDDEEPKATEGEGGVEMMDCESALPPDGSGRPDDDGAAAAEEEDSKDEMIDFAVTKGSTTKSRRRKVVDDDEDDDDGPCGEAELVMESCTEPKAEAEALQVIVPASTTTAVPAPASDEWDDEAAWDAIMG